MERIYKRLEEKYWLEAKRGSGTFVALDFPNHKHFYPDSRAVNKLPISLTILPISETIYDAHFHDFTTIGVDKPEPHHLISLLYFIKMKKEEMDYLSFDQLNRVTAMQGVEYKIAIFDYLNLRRYFAINLKGLEVIVGRRESLEQIFNALLKPGDVMVNTSPKDKPLCDILKTQSMVKTQIIEMNTNFLPELKKLLSHTKIKAVYLRPQCSYSDSYTLESSVCTELLVLAKQHNFYIVEEDDFHEFWHEPKPFKPLICRKHNGHVIYCGALSLLSAYLQQTRTIVASEEFIALMQNKPIIHSPFRDIIMEAVLVDLLVSNKLWRSVKKAQNETTEYLFNAWFQIDIAISKILQVKKPSSGLSFWITFPDDESLLESMDYLEKQGVKIPYFPGEQKPGKGVKHIRLGFGTWNIEEAQELLTALLEKFKSEN